MCLSDCSKCKYFDHNPHHSGDIICGVNPAYAELWKRLKSLDKKSLDCLPIDNCREFKLDPSLEEKAIALSLNFFDWQKLERETSNPTIGKALRDTIIELNLSQTCENWQQIANSTSIAVVRVTLESEGIQAKKDPWIHVDSSCIDAVAYLEDSLTLKIRFNLGDLYQYNNVPYEVFLNLLDADSKGHFLNRNIKGIYSYQQL